MCVCMYNYANEIFEDDHVPYLKYLTMFPLKIVTNADLIPKH